MHESDQYLTLPVQKNRFQGCMCAGLSFFVFFFLLKVSFDAYPTEPQALFLTIPSMAIALYIGVLWLLLAAKKLRLISDELQVLQFGRCIKTIPASALRMACMVTSTQRRGKNGTSRRLQRRLAISSISMRDLADREQDSLTHYFVKRMKYRFPIEGVWADCYPELVAGLRRTYPHLQWEKVSTVSLKKTELKDDDPYCFMRKGIEGVPGGMSTVMIVAIIVALVFGVFAFMGFRIGEIRDATVMLGIGIVLIVVLLASVGVDKALVRLSPQGIEIHSNGKNRFYSSAQLRTAMVFTKLDYSEGEYQVIVFSTLSAREIAEKQEAIIRRTPGGANKLRQWKKIPNWGTRLVYRYSRHLLLLGTGRARKTNYIIHTQQREQTLRELYPNLQWLNMTDEFEVIV